jgi:nucleotide-binding universal stress UspA family protein
MPTAQSSEPRRIVVGVDGSDPSVRALRWAMGEARLRRVELLVLSCWTLPVTGGIPVTGESWDDRMFSDTARAALRACAAEAELDAADGLRWSEEVRCGSPAERLTEESEHAEMIVVGSRGRGGFAGLLLGSVSQQVAAHSRCPVVIVH